MRNEDKRRLDAFQTLIAALDCAIDIQVCYFEIHNSSLARQNNFHVAKS